MGKKRKKIITGVKNSGYERLAKTILTEKTIAAENVKKIEKFHDNITLRSFVKITPEVMEKIIKRFKLKKPEVKRLKKTSGQISYLRWFEGNICIFIYTSFVPSLGKNGEFAPKGYGGGFVLVTRNVTERLYVRQYYRGALIDKFLERLINEAMLLACQHEFNRPLDSRNQPMIVKKDEKGIRWVSSSDEKETKFFLNGEIPSILRTHAEKQKIQDERYENVTRVEKKIISRKKDKRKTWD